MRTRRTLAAILLVALGIIRAGGVDRRAQAQVGGWVTEAPLPVAKTGLVAVIGVNGHVYVFGGTDNATRDYSDAEVYDPGTNSWTQLAPLPVSESYASATLGRNGQIYIIGGFDSVGGRSLNTVFAYDPTTNTYACSANYSGCTSSTLAPMPTARSVMATTQSGDGKIWEIGGYTSQPVATVEVYDPASNTWTEEPALPSPESGASAEALPTGDVLVWGGFDGQTYNSSTFLLALPTSSVAPAVHVLGAQHQGRLGTEGRPLADIQQERPFAAHVNAPPPYWCKYPPPKRLNEVTWVAIRHSIFDLERKLGSAAQFIVWYLGAGDLITPNDTKVMQDYLNRVCAGAQPLTSETRAGRSTGRSTFRELTHPGVAPHQVPAAVHVPPVVFAGGQAASGVSTLVSVYDWLMDSWSSGPSLPGPREGGASAYGPNGTVFVIGGDDGRNVYSTVFAWTPPLLTLTLPGSNTATPTVTVMASPTSTLTAMSTSTATATATSTFAPTPTPLPLTVHLAVKRHKVKPGQSQTLTLTTTAGAKVTITVTFPDRKKLHHGGSADVMGRLTWRFKEPKGVRSGLTVNITTMVTYLGDIARTSGHYKTG